VKFVLTLVMLLSLGLLLANVSGHEGIVERMPNLVMQLGLLILAARLGAILVEKLHIPGVLGELLIGVLIGPYLLGGIPINGFENGLFASGNQDFPLQPELYGIAIIASIILLFLSGLETDLSLLIRFSLAGTVIGLGGIFFSFLFGALTAMAFLHVPLMDPKCLFLGIMSTATSVGITARILSDQRKMDTPEGVTILAGAVIDDVLGVVLLAVIIGISAATKSGKALQWSNIGIIAFKEIGIWLGCTALGLYFAHKLGGFLKWFKNRIVFSVLAFSLALVVAGLFERAGLAMIIGAYVVGITLSKTDISVTIQETLHPLKVFFVPVFFTVMGMLVDVRALFSPSTLFFGCVYTAGAVAAKYLGCGIPSLALRFNLRGANRIGLGMIPRGEVALIIASIGLSYGFLADPGYNIFSIAVFMTLITTLVSPPLLNFALKSPHKGVKDSLKMPEKESIVYQMEDKDLAMMFVHKLVQQFQNMDFFVNNLEGEGSSYHIRKSNSALTLEIDGSEIVIQTEKDNALFVRRMIHNALVELKSTMQHVLDADHLNVKVSSREQNKQLLAAYLKPDLILPRLSSDTKEGIVWAMLAKAEEQGYVQNMKTLYYAVESTWHKLSPGLTHGIAIPHLHSELVSEIVIVCAVSHKGADFQSIDRRPSHLIFLILTPLNKSDEHIKVLSIIARLKDRESLIKRLCAIDDPEEMKNAILQDI